MEHMSTPHQPEIKPWHREAAKEILSRLEARGHVLHSEKYGTAPVMTLQELARIIAECEPAGEELCMAAERVLTPSDKTESMKAADRYALRQAIDSARTREGRAG